ncbi:MAG TPA: amino acid adenylation domain-containing protein, partial [Candidatus Angelobacter sp.]
MSCAELLLELRNLGARVWLEDDRLRVAAPQGALTNEIRRELKDRRSELLEWLKRQASARQPRPALVARKRPERVPLSYAQQRLWFLDQLDPGTAAYSMRIGIRLRGELDRVGMEWSLREIVSRHEVLRTTFPANKGTPVQKISSVPEFGWKETDLRRLPAAEREVETRRLAIQEGRRVFDLSRGPLLWMELLRLGAQEHVLLVNMHNIIADLWSAGIIMREFSELYTAYVRGQQPTLAELSVQYADYAVWQRKWLQGEVLERQLGYWQKQLAEVQALELPTDRPRPPMRSYLGGSVPIDFGADLSRQAKEFSRREGVTLFMTLLTVFNMVLARYARQKDIAVGTHVANRRRSETEKLIGLFLNDVVLRTDLSGNLGFKELLRRIRQTTLQAYEHQDIPFDQLVEKLQSKRDLSRAPLFQASLHLLNTPEAVLDIPGIELQWMDISQAVARNDLELVFTESKEGLLTGTAVYATDLFEGRTIGRLVRHMENVLAEVMRTGEHKIEDVSLLSAAERAEILAKGSQTEVELLETTAQELMEDQAQRNPEAVAVEYEEESWSYGELNRRANQLAHYLRRLGVGPEVRVGIYMPRAAGMVVGLLGVLKAGGVYVPLDPGYPGERLAYMVEDASVSVVLSGEAQVPWKEPTKKVKVLWIQQEWPLIGAESEANLDKVVDGENLAYVVYTSGSTGRPKGAMITHYGLTNHLRAKIVDLELAHQDVVAQNSPSSFDISIWQILAPLAVGGRVCVIKDDAARDVGELLKACQERGVTVLETVPTMLAVMISEQKGRRRVGLDRLRWLICQAEPLPNDMIKQWREMHPHVGLVNAYGATECSDDVSHCHIEEELPEGLAYGPLGNPLINAKIFVLDRKLEVVPVSVMGEMYIGGKVPGRGYLDRPELTAEKFIPNPYGGCGERMYWTGDVGRWRTDGLLEFIGRVDNQVKLRGQRVELGEVEAALNEHADVEQAVVMVNEDKWGEKRLVAYLVARKTTEGKEDQENEPIANQVQSWAQVFDTTYASGDGNQEPTLDLTGWNSSYTGLPIPQPEMQEWLDGTLQRIQKVKASRVLEIGCGSGMLLFRIAPQCNRYCGTDVSVQGLKRLRQRLNALGGYAQVSLLEREANNFSGLTETFDAVLLNSVVQFFPSVTYLRQVLDGAIASLREGGFIFLGDVRSLPLLQAFHASVYLEKASSTMGREEFRQKVMQRVVEEEEFAVAPAFFQKLQQEIAGIKRILMLPRKGRSANELTKFRYDVIIEVGREETAPADDIVWLDWNRDRLDLESISSMLASQSNKRIGITGVPNKRLDRERKLQRWLDGGEGPATVEEMRRSLELQDQDSGVELHDLWDMAERFPCNVELGWGQHSNDGNVDVLFVPRGGSDDRWEGIKLPLVSGEHVPWSACANDPLLSVRRKKLISELRSSLLQRLPEYMVPSFYVPLNKLPLTPNGKVDRRALPAPDFESEEPNQSYSAPRTFEEEILCGIVSSVLNRQRIGIDDNFFEMGGHSLLATQVVSRVRSAFNIEMPLRAIFESPTVSGMAEQVKRELEKGKTVEVPILKRRSISGNLPLSYAQQRLWFLDQLQPNSSAYNISSALRLRGELKVELLERALVEIVRRHEVLRTRFENVGGEPQQVIEVESRIGMPVVDLSGQERSEREAEVRRRAQEESEEAFDLGRGPLLRVKLLKLEKQEYVLLVTMHHIVSDGWSMRILVQECAALYGGYSEGREGGLAELPIQYGDYAVWQREWMRGEVLEEQLGYWRKQLAGVEVLELATDRVRPALQTNAGAILPFVLKEELSAGLKEMSRREGVTLFMTLLGAFQAMLWRYSGQGDISVGAPIAGRRWKEIEGLIGFFVNTLVLRTKIKGEESFRELLGRVRETTLEAYRHQDVPFEKLVEELQPERDLSRQPFFQIMFALLNTGPAELELPNLKLNTFALEDKTRAAKFDLILSMVDHKQGISGFIEYNTDLFDHSTVSLMLRRFQLMLEQVVKEEGIGIGRMELLSEEERREVEKGYGGEEGGEGEEEGVLEGVEKEGKRRPERIALVEGEKEKTYGELEEEVAKWGRY